MKILIDQHWPFPFAHGGTTTQLEQTKLALERAGVEVEFMRRWDGKQRGNLVHFFGSTTPGYLDLAHQARMPVVTQVIFSETCNRPLSRLKRQGWMVQAILSAPFGEALKRQLVWRSFQLCAHNVVGLEAERRVLNVVYRVPDDRITVVPLGISDVFIQAGPGNRTEPYLICPGTITEVKNSVALARMARAAQTPVLFVGKPYHADDPYWRTFHGLVDHQWVRYRPHVESQAEMAQLLQSARGFVLMSNYENWCLSAHEAAACGLPLLLQDQNWSRERFGDQIRYFASIGETAENIRQLKQFYEDAPRLAAPRTKIFTWDEAAVRLKAVYERVLKEAHSASV